MYDQTHIYKEAKVEEVLQPFRIHRTALHTTKLFVKIDGTWTPGRKSADITITTISSVTLSETTQKTHRASVKLSDHTAEDVLQKVKDNKLEDCKAYIDFLSACGYQSIDDFRKEFEG